MPSSVEILQSLARIANEGFALAIAWHVVVVLLIADLLVGWRPSRRVAELLLCLPIASVSAVAFAFGNPFNGIVFGVLAIALVTLAAFEARDRGTPGYRWTWWSSLGSVLVGFAWVYPHFLEGRAPTAYLYGAPVGLIPCPTLLLVIGFALVMGSGGHRAWKLVLAGAGLFYGITGMVQLHVWIDAALIVGSAALIALAFVRVRKAPRAPISAPRPVAA